MGSLTAFIVGLIRALHGKVLRSVTERDRYSTRYGVSSYRRGSSIAVDFGLQGEIPICYQTNAFSCGQVGVGDAGLGRKSLWITLWI